MTFEHQVRDYFEGWNEHRPDAVTALFSNDGTFADPTLEIPAKRTDFGAVMYALINVFPDYRFQVRSLATAGGRAFAEWSLSGTNCSPWKVGIDATGKSVHLNGVDVIDDGAGGFSRVTRYYDQKSLVEQIGLQVIIEPTMQSKATYGYSKRVASGNPHIPAAFGLTWILFRDQSELAVAVCHGVAVLRYAKLGNGELLAKGKTVTGFANAEEDFADNAVWGMKLLPRDKRIMPWRIEDEMKKIGANYVQAGLWRGFAIRDSNLITGQQNFSGLERPRNS